MTGVKDRMQLAGTQMREQRAEMKADRAERRNRRLLEQTDVLRSELEREREGREELLGLLKDGKVGSHRGRTTRLIVVGGVAYLLGARAGRERYEQILAWVRRMKEQARRGGSESVVDVSHDAIPARSER